MAQAKLAFIILAAGKGTRMKSNLPKVLHKVAGRELISHVVELAKSFKPDRVITVVGPGSSAVSEVAKTEYVVQKKQLGTGDAVKAAAKQISSFDGKVVILYADSPLLTEDAISRLIKSADIYNIGLIGFNAADPGRYGRLITDGHFVQDIVEYKDANAQQREIKICNAGIYALDRKLLFELVDEIKDDNAAGEFYLTDIIKIAASRGLSTGLTLTDEEQVLGINTKFELANAERIMQNRLRRKHMEDGVTMIAPETVFLSMDTRFGKDVTINPDVVIGEDVVIGDGVKLGPFAHIRAGSRIGDEVKIGNFVEIKKSKIGKRSAVSHLSYIGDSTLGKNVNIGAGTITCNYDGFKKYETVIGDGVFIGSNSALVAPVEIGDEAIVAAGSVITKDVPPKSLGITRALQKNLADWAVRFRKDRK